MKSNLEIGIEKEIERLRLLIASEDDVIRASKDTQELLRYKLEALLREQRRHELGAHVPTFEYVPVGRDETVIQVARTQ